MALNSNNYFQLFLDNAPLTHNVNSPLKLSHVAPFPYEDNSYFSNGIANNVGNYAGERNCIKQSSNYTSLMEKELPHSKLFFVLTSGIISDIQQAKQTADAATQSNPKTILGLSFAGRDTLRYINENNPNVDKFC